MLPIIEPNKHEEKVLQNSLYPEDDLNEGDFDDNSAKHFVKLSYIEELAAKTKQ